MKTYKFVTYIIVILMLSGCYTKQAAIRKFCQQDTARATITVTVHDTIQLPGDTVLFEIHPDSLFEDSLTKVFEDSLNLILATKSKGTTKFKVISKPQILYRTKEVKVKVALPCNCPQPGVTTMQKIGAVLLALSFLFLGLWFGKFWEK